MKKSALDALDMTPEKVLWCCIRYFLGKEGVEVIRFTKRLPGALDCIEENAARRMVCEILEAVAMGKAGDPEIEAACWLKSVDKF